MDYRCDSVCHDDDDVNAVCVARCSMLAQEMWQKGVMHNFMSYFKMNQLGTGAQTLDGWIERETRQKSGGKVCCIWNRAEVEQYVGQQLRRQPKLGMHAACDC